MNEVLHEFRQWYKLNDVAAMNEVCYAVKGGSPQIKRVRDDANVIFQVGGSRVFRSTQSTQNYEEMNVCTESELLRSQSTDDLSRHGGCSATEGWTLPSFTFSSLSNACPINQRRYNEIVDARTPSLLPV